MTTQEKQNQDSNIDTSHASYRRQKKQHVHGCQAYRSRHQKLNLNNGTPAQIYPLPKNSNPNRKGHNINQQTATVNKLADQYNPLKITRESKPWTNSNPKSNKQHRTLDPDDIDAKLEQATEIETNQPTVWYE